MARRLSDSFLRSVRAPLTGQQEHFDQAVPGLALRVTHKGRKSWTVLYRHHGKRRRYTIGRYPAITLSKAREKARDVLTAADGGTDPAAEKIDAKRLGAPVARDVASVLARYVERYARPRLRRWREVERSLNRYVVPAWGHRPVDTIARRDVIALLDTVADTHGPVMANRVLAYARRAFTWAIEKDLIEASPFVGIRAPAPEPTRERVLSDAELRAVWHACEGEGWPFGRLFQLLILTAQRRGETASMRWADIDFDGRLWTVPGDQRKSGRLHEVPLSDAAARLLEALPRRGDYVFTTTGATPVSGFSLAKGRIDAASGVTGWHLHDLRRTAATNMARHEVPVSTISRILDHAEGGVTKIYNRYSYANEKRRALELWAGRLAEIVGAGPGRVIPLGRGAA
jgi:integrase